MARRFNGGLLLTSLAGAALFVWWAVRFHRRHEHKWMASTGMILTGTSAIVWISVTASDYWKRSDPSTPSPDAGPPTANSNHSTVVNLEK